MSRDFTPVGCKATRATKTEGLRAFMLSRFAPAQTLVGIAAILMPGMSLANPREQASPRMIAAAYQGRWQAHFVDTGAGSSLPLTSDKEIANECGATPAKATCRQIVDGKVAATLIFTPVKGRSGQFEVRTIPADDGPASTGQLLIAGNQWFYPWQEQRNGHPVMFRIVNSFLTPGRIAFSKQFRVASGEWRTLSSGIEVRLDAIRVDQH